MYLSIAPPHIKCGGAVHYSNQITTRNGPFDGLPFEGLSGPSGPVEGRVNEGFVGFSHSMRSLFFGDSASLSFVRSFEFGKKRYVHRFACGKLNIKQMNKIARHENFEVFSFRGLNYCRFEEFFVERE